VIRNLLEEHVLAAYEPVIRHFPDFCGCEICRADVLVYALNRLPPKYVAATQGRILSEVNLDKDQARASIEVALMEGIRKVSLAPRCGRKAKPVA
jgi:competence protein ComFB